MSNKRKKGFFAQFREFAIRGNALDLAVGVVIGGAFSKIVSSLVDAVLMPVLGVVLGGVDISAFTVTLPPLWPGQTVPNEFPVGRFGQAVVEFLFIAFALFLLIKAINKLRALQPKPSEPDPEPPKPTKTEELLQEIRDGLKKTDTAVVNDL